MRRFVLTSALGLDERSRDAVPYFGAKWEMEAAVRESGLEHVIFRPSFVFGKDGGALQVFKRLARLAPVTPIVGDGTRRLQPIWVEDVAEFFARSLDTGSGVVELGGPDAVTWNDFWDRLKRVMGKRRPSVHVPVGLMRVQAAVMERLPEPTGDARPADDARARRQRRHRSGPRRGVRHRARPARRAAAPRGLLALLRRPRACALVLEQPALHVEAAAEAGQRAVRADETVAGEDDRERVGAVRRADCARRAGDAEPPRLLAVAPRLAVRDLGERRATRGAGSPCPRARAAGRTSAACRRSTPGAAVPPPRALLRRPPAPGSPGQRIRRSPRSEATSPSGPIGVSTCTSIDCTHEQSRRRLRGPGCAARGRGDHARSTRIARGAGARRGLRGLPQRPARRRDARLGTAVPDPARPRRRGNRRGGRRGRDHGSRPATAS